MLKSIKRYFNFIVVNLILGIRPILGVEGFCRYPITCTKYAEEVLSETSFLMAICKITLRVLSCNPVLPKSWLEKKL